MVEISHVSFQCPGLARRPPHGISATPARACTDSPML